MTVGDRITSWLALTFTTAIVVSIAFPGGIHRVQEHYANRFGFAPTIGFVLSILIGVAAAIALVAPAGVWIATRIFGYVVTPPPPNSQDRTMSVALALVVVGFFVLLGATPVIGE